MHGVFLTCIVFIGGFVTGGSILYLLMREETLMTKRVSPVVEENDEMGSVFRKEQLARNFGFLGDEAMERLANSLVIVVGCGGVGAHAAHMLARSGIGHLRLVDFDYISLSSLNRAPLARRKDVGMSKVAHLGSELREICPWIVVEEMAEMFTPELADKLVGEPFRSGLCKYKSILVLDCIDHIHTKAYLLDYCYRNGYPVLSSAGAGCKWDPTCVSISDISKTADDPLARHLRYQLRVRGITRGIPIVYSRERYNGIKLLPENPEVKEASPLDSFRSRIVPVLGPMPAIFGMTMAMYAIKMLVQETAEQQVQNSGVK